MALYLDASALVKLVLPEPETVALEQFLERDRAHASSAIVRVEVMRAAHANGSPVVRAQAREALRRLLVVSLDDGLLDKAAELEAPLRTLDAIHLVSAELLGKELKAFVTYDARLFDAAVAAGLPAVAPGRRA